MTVYSKEEWRDIHGYEGLYQVSDQGRVRSIPHIVFTSGRVNRFHKGKELKIHTSPKGYQRVLLSQGGKIQWHYVHRLVAIAFVNGSGPQINHKNENKKDNRAMNLEWCTASYNNKYGHHNDTMIALRSKAVKRISKEGLTETYPSLSEACRKTGVSTWQIWRACNGFQDQAGEYRWSYL